MKYFRIGTLNCQNSRENRKYVDEHAALLGRHIITHAYDILGTQELTKKFMKKVNEYLKEYNFYGGYQYGRSIGTKLPILKDYNQSNQIMTTKKVIKVRTKALPWFPFNYDDLVKGLKKMSISRRIVTIIELEVIDKTVYVINTHLDYYLPRIQRRQLTCLLKLVKKYSKNGLVVLMGDFNLQTSNAMFSEFESSVNALGLRRVPVNEKTNANKFKSKSAIDHIFIPKKWKIASCGIFDTDELNLITDHKAVYVDVII